MHTVRYTELRSDRSNEPGATRTARPFFDPRRKGVCAADLGPGATLRTTHSPRTNRTRGSSGAPGWDAG
jgi:hypothetical protein